MAECLEQQGWPSESQITENYGMWMLRDVFPDWHGSITHTDMMECSIPLHPREVKNDDSGSHLRTVNRGRIQENTHQTHKISLLIQSERKHLLLYADHILNQPGFIITYYVCAASPQCTPTSNPIMNRWMFELQPLNLPMCTCPGASSCCHLIGSVDAKQILQMNIAIFLWISFSGLSASLSWRSFCFF